jgi:iron only hydrogenase large subunit-like protein
MASVLLGDLNDFIAPSQACVNPLFAEPARGQQGGAVRLSLSLDLEGEEGDADATVAPQVSFSAPAKPDLIRSTGEGGKKKATVSLNDCLACSGCVTSAETVLISQQSTERFRKALDEASCGAYDKVVASISPHSRASIADRFGVSVAVAQAKVTALLQAMGVHFVMDAAAAADVALVETKAELFHRLNSGGEVGRRGCGWQRPIPSMAVSAKEQVDMKGRVQPADKTPSVALPMLISACPGWVCYAEKTAAEAIPYMSTVKSPQQVAGVVLKHLLPRQWGIEARRVLHVTVMPCFDKKLEASRKDFLHGNNMEEGGDAEVDLVLTTSELLELFVGEAGPSVGVDDFFHSLPVVVGPGPPGDFASAPPGILSMDTASCDGHSLMYHAAGDAVGAAGGSSGGYVEYLFRCAAKEMYGIELPPDKPLPYQRGRNADVHELRLDPDDGRPPLVFALAYGFRNIQAVLSQLKRGTCKYQLVEIMACPGGCVNGGGQLKDKGETPDAMRQRAAAVSERLLGGAHRRLPEENPFVVDVYEKLLHGGPLSPAALECVHTTYHAVPPLEQFAAPLISW